MVREEVGEILLGRVVDFKSSDDIWLIIFSIYPSDTVQTIMDTTVGPNSDILFLMC